MVHTDARTSNETPDSTHFGVAQGINRLASFFESQPDTRSRDPRIAELLKPLSDFTLKVDAPEDAKSQQIDATSLNKIIVNGSTQEVVASVTGIEALRQLEEFVIVQRIVQSHYDIGEITGLHRLSGGVINDSFLVECTKDEEVQHYFFRRYAEDKKEKWIEFEHMLLRHLREHGFNISAQLIPASDGTTWVQFPDKNGNERYHMMTSILHGDNIYSHEKNDLSEIEVQSLGRTFATFHNIASTLGKTSLDERFQKLFRPAEPRMLRKFYKRKFAEIKDSAANIMEHFDRREEESHIVSALFKHAKDGIAALENPRNELDAATYLRLPHVPIHHDLHPGNVLFHRNEVSGLFDLDFVKIDARVFDVALTSIFLCTDWEASLEKGPIDVDKMLTFISSYQEGGNFYQEQGVQQLTKDELNVLVPMMHIANGMLIHWYLNDFAENMQHQPKHVLKEMDKEYGLVIKQRLAASIWLEQNRELVEGQIQSVLPKK